uniref:Uncharacterized protein n=1 Tax=Anguilla anguilla TaxID=7936 RepID=A0A0E9PZ12_ANGAN
MAVWNRCSNGLPTVPITVQICLCDGFMQSDILCCVPFLMHCVNVLKTCLCAVIK